MYKLIVLAEKGQPPYCNVASERTNISIPFTLLYFAVGSDVQHTKGAAGSRYRFFYEPTEPSQPMMNDDVNDKDRPQHREVHLLLFSNSVSVLYRPTELCLNKVCETRPPVYRPYPRTLESLIICRWHYNFTKVNCLSTYVVSLSELGRLVQRVKMCPCDRLRCKRVLAGDGLGIGKR